MTPRSRASSMVSTKLCHDTKSSAPHPPDSPANDSDSDSESSAPPHKERDGCSDSDRDMAKDTETTQDLGVTCRATTRIATRSRLPQLFMYGTKKLSKCHGIAVTVTGVNDSDSDTESSAPHTASEPSRVLVDVTGRGDVTGWGDVTDRGDVTARAT